MLVVKLEQNTGTDLQSQIIGFDGQAETGHGGQAKTGDKDRPASNRLSVSVGKLKQNTETDVLTVKGTVTGFELFNCESNIMCLYSHQLILPWGDMLRAQTHQPMFISCSYCRRIGRLNLYECCDKSMECTSLFVKMGINYPQAKISTKLMKFTVLYMATMKGGKQLL